MDTFQWLSFSTWQSNFCRLEQGPVQKGSAFENALSSSQYLFCVQTEKLETVSSDCSRQFKLRSYLLFAGKPAAAVGNRAEGGRLHTSHVLGPTCGHSRGYPCLSGVFARHVLSIFNGQVLELNVLLGNLIGGRADLNQQSLIAPSYLMPLGNNCSLISLSFLVISPFEAYCKVCIDNTFTERLLQKS